MQLALVLLLFSSMQQTQDPECCHICHKQGVIMQPKKVVVSKYAEKDKAAREAAARAAAYDPNDKAAVMRAQADGEMAMMADMLGVEGGVNPLDSMKPTSNAEFEQYAQKIAERYATPHKSAKQYKYFIKQVCIPAAFYLQFIFVSYNAGRGGNNLGDHAQLLINHMCALFTDVLVLQHRYVCVRGSYIIYALQCMGVAGFRTACNLGGT